MYKQNWSLFISLIHNQNGKKTKQNKKTKEQKTKNKPGILQNADDPQEKIRTKEMDDNKICLE